VDRRRLLTSALLLGAASGVGGCAAFIPPQTEALLAERPADLPSHVELSATPFFPQTELQCGPAALATVLVALGIEVTPAQLTETVFLPARQGSLQVEMLAAARRQGALAVRVPGELQAVLREVAAGHPVLVMQNLGLGFAPAWHYAVLMGYELDLGVAVLRSGTTRREILPLRTFEHTWARSGHWAFVAVKPGELPATAPETEVAAATVALERSVPAATAARAYDAALQRWPHNLTLAMGLGNARATAGDLAGAASAFEHAARQHNSAVAWNNLAHMRMKQGQHAAAVEAAQRAVERAEAAEPQWLSITKATLATAQFQVR
jgi:hypothetical protein